MGNIWTLMNCALIYAGRGGTQINSRLVYLQLECERCLSEWHTRSITLQVQREAIVLLPSGIRTFFIAHMKIWNAASIVPNTLSDRTRRNNNIAHVQHYDKLNMNYSIFIVSICINFSSIIPALLLPSALSTCTFERPFPAFAVMKVQRK